MTANFIFTAWEAEIHYKYERVLNEINLEEGQNKDHK
jgi:hypothetical protein